MAAIVPKPISVLPKTGQTTSYPNGNETDRDDGHYQAGKTVLYRFINNMDGTVTDNVTGLMWVQQPELIIPGPSVISSNQIQAARGPYGNGQSYSIGDLVSGAGLFYVCVFSHLSNGKTIIDDLSNFPDSWRQTVWTNSAINLTTPASMSWKTAIANCEPLDYAGSTDWRLPNIEELQSIVDYGVYPPQAIDGTIFLHTYGPYWSSTTNASNAGSAWYVDFGNGTASNIDKQTSFVLIYVRPVRGGR